MPRPCVTGKRAENAEQKSVEMRLLDDEQRREHECDRAQKLDQHVK